jgi:hypothetical protein
MKVYAIRNKKGEYFRSASINGYRSTWTTLDRARIYTKIGVPKGVITGRLKYEDEGLELVTYDLIENEE